VRASCARAAPVAARPAANAAANSIERMGFSSCSRCRGL